MKLLGILISLTVAEEIKKKTENKRRILTTSKTHSPVVNSKSEERTNRGQQSLSPTLGNGRSITKTTKASKTVANKDDRNKRTLYDFGNAGFLYSEVAAKRLDHGRYYDPYLVEHNALGGGGVGGGILVNFSFFFF